MLEHGMAYIVRTTAGREQWARWDADTRTFRWDYFSGKQGVLRVQDVGAVAVWTQRGATGHGRWKPLLVAKDAKARGRRGRA